MWHHAKKGLFIMGKMDDSSMQDCATSNCGKAQPNATFCFGMLCKNYAHWVWWWHISAKSSLNNVS